MDWNRELETDALTEDELEDYWNAADTCNGFAFWYLETVNENAVVKDVFTDFGQAHCVVYDPDLDVVIDGTLGQFDSVPAVAGAWDGENYPYADDVEEVYEWTDRDAFEAEYDEMGSPFLV